MSCQLFCDFGYEEGEVKSKGRVSGGCCCYYFHSRGTLSVPRCCGEEGSRRQGGGQMTASPRGGWAWVHLDWFSPSSHNSLTLHSNLTLKIIPITEQLKFHGLPLCEPHLISLAIGVCNPMVYYVFHIRLTTKPLIAGSTEYTLGNEHPASCPAHVLPLTTTFPNQTRTSTTSLVKSWRISSFSIK